MEAYEGFASVYDLFMEDTNYDEWVLYIHEIWEKEKLEPQLICDLGCGTGNVTLRLAKEGYDMIGVDLSADMLSVAREKAEADGLGSVLFLNQDMREFELYGTVNCVLSLYDSLNYITSEDDLLQVFRLVNNYLHPKGLFIFDMNTEYKFKNILAENTFAETDDDAVYVWENFYDEEDGINQFYMNFFVKNETGAYDRFEEEHYEKAYSLETIKRLVTESGLELLHIYDAYTFLPPKAHSQRVFVIAREALKKE